MRLPLTLACLSALLLAGSGAAAAPILAPPGSPDFDASLDALRKGYERMEDEFVTPENGLFLDPIVAPAEVITVEAFFAQIEEQDFELFSGKHPYEVLLSYDEHGDEGNFAGIASVGVAARLMVLRKEGAPAAEIARARAAVVRAAKAWHAYGTIGGPGVVARGVRRVTPASPTDPPFPGAPVEIVPLFDANGAPLPADKVAVWRAPVAAGLDGWIWLDDTSKDQISGYALAVAWLWDALQGDPEAPVGLAGDMAAGLAAAARALMTTAPEKGIDLCIRDADGRLTKHHDLNPRTLTPEGAPVPEDFSLKNGFNALLALGVIRAAYHVSGDDEIGRYYYEELIGRRLMAVDPTTTLGIMYVGGATNYSNVNMAAIGLATLGRFETDPYVRERIAEALATQFWNAGSDRDASHVEQAWFDAIYGAYASAAPYTISQRVRQNLGGFPPAPCFERDRINCDATEIEAGQCVAIDGSTLIELLPGEGHGGQPVAKDIVPMSIRPDSDFMWRSDPHQVNGGASTRMDPRGDFLAAYWLARASELATPDANLSPNARPPLSYTLGPIDPEAEPPAQSNTEDTGCGCRAAGRTDSLPGIAALVMLGLAALRRQRAASCD